MIDHLAVVRTESDRLGDVLARCEPDRRVPSCPDWSTSDMLAHVVTVQRFWAHVIGDRLTAAQVQAYQQDRPPLPTDFGELLELRSAATADLVAALAGHDASEPAWSWFAPDQTVGFTRRMQTHEATVHRVDAELAAARAVGPVAPEVAEDGLDQLLDVMWNWALTDVERRATATVELRTSDTGTRRWLQLFRWSGADGGEPVVDQIGCRREAGTAADAVVAGSAKDLLLFLWGRTDGGISQSGDDRAWRELQAMRDDGTG